ncbi:MAG: hypothetical protein QOE70_6139 [Chthoniobacter sp.]|jgi:hypothetical protein|nr:hypothetical protein [Chthoniobacter sp.]
MNIMHLRFLSPFPLLLLMGFFAGCEAVDAPDNAARAAMNSAIKAEPPGDYFIGRRYYKVDYKFWGWVRKPGQPWSLAKMVMLNEHEKLAPDRALGKLGSDNNHEYKLYGSFSGETVYEPASNGFYPEFILKSYELLSATPANIYKSPLALDPTKRVILQPY